MKDKSILFRGKRLDNGEWVYGFPCPGLIKGMGMPICNFSDDSYELGTFLVDPNTVGQFVGLCDADGKKIFEDDIILYGCGKKLVVWWNEEAFQWQAKEQQYPVYTFEGARLNHGVVWDNIDFGWIAAEIPIRGEITTKVIGNIHDNSDTLEGYNPSKDIPDHIGF